MQSYTSWRALQNNHYDKLLISVFEGASWTVLEKMAGITSKQPSLFRLLKKGT